MTSYTITANGTTMGTYEGATRDEAILAYVRDAGYASVEDAAEALSMTREAFLADIDVDVCETMLTVETMDVDFGLGMCAEVRIERGARLVSKGRCYMGQMPSLRSCVARALEGAMGQALLAGVPADELVEAGRRVLDDDYAWARAETAEGSWEHVERVYR